MENDMKRKMLEELLAKQGLDFEPMNPLDVEPLPEEPKSPSPKDLEPLPGEDFRQMLASADQFAPIGGRPKPGMSEPTSMSDADFQAMVQRRAQEGKALDAGQPKRRYGNIRKAGGFKPL